MPGGQPDPRAPRAGIFPPPGEALRQDGPEPRHHERVAPGVRLLLLRLLHDGLRSARGDGSPGVRVYVLPRQRRAQHVQRDALVGGG
eukprot:1974247-Pyramimonas_sp.AAC.1